MSNRFDRRRYKWLETKKEYTNLDSTVTTPGLEVGEDDLEVSVFFIDYEHIYARKGKDIFSFPRYRANTAGVVIGDKLIVKNDAIKRKDLKVMSVY